MLPPAAWAVLVPAVLLAACAAPPSQPHEGHRVLLHGNGKLAIVEPDGSISLERPWGGIHDLHLSAEGQVFVQRGWGEVVELDLASGEVLWSYASGTSHGNAGVPVEVHAFQPLARGRMMIAESGPARILEVERDGSVISETPLTVDHPHPHMDTRLVRKIAADRYLVCHEGDGVVRGPTVDFGRWLESRFCKEDYVHVKMDIEGAEYDVVPHLLREKVADLIDELFLEVHTETNSCCKPPHDAGRHRPDAMRLLQSLRDAGVYAHEWL